MPAKINQGNETVFGVREGVKYDRKDEIVFLRLRFGNPLIPLNEIQQIRERG
jgi:hypothetical protein